MVLASVKEPRSWPKSSDSMSCSGSAAQSTSIIGPFLRGPLSWMAWAMRSFPVPLSPESRTVGVSTSSSRRSISKSFRMAVDSPMIEA